MGKGRFLNQKLGKRVSRKVSLLKGQLSNRKVSQPQLKSSLSSSNSPAHRKSASTLVPSIVS